METGSVTEEAARAALLGVVDPELGDNVVDLGMVRRVLVDGQVVTVELALTVAGCPLRTQLRQDVERRVGSLPGVTQVHVDTVEMDADERAAVMARARFKARDRALATEIPPTARVLAIVSGKGGVGKSSITVNLACTLAAR